MVGAMNPIIRLEKVSKEYNMGKAGTLSVLRGITLNIAPGEFVAVTGPSRRQAAAGSRHSSWRVAWCPRGIPPTSPFPEFEAVVLLVQYSTFRRDRAASFLPIP